MQKPKSVAKTSVNSHAVLSQRYYKNVCAVSLFGFFLSFLVLGINNASNKYFCANKFEWAQWTREWNVATAGALVVIIVLQLGRLSLSTFREDSDIGTLSSYYVSITANSISAVAHLSTLFQWGGVCRDVFGVYTPAMIWPEWAISIPLMMFLSVSADDRPQLARQDSLSIASLFLCVLCGAMQQIISDRELAISFLVLSGVFCVPGFVLVWRANKNLEYVLKKSMESDTIRGLYQRRILLASRKATLSTCIGCLFPALPVIYGLRVFYIINDDMFFISVMFASSFMKLCFASLCMDAHLEVSHPAIALLDAENFANTSRRAFLRYVFHEVRVPLNSISMGVQLLESSDKIVDEDRDTIFMVKEAVGFMGETLNDVMALQKVEEGSLELIYKSFSVVDLFQNVEDSFIDTSVDYGVILSTDVDPRIPARIVGDKFRIRHVLANLVSNALKYSFSGGHVQLRATFDAEDDSHEYGSLPVHDSGNFVTIIFTVVDEGKGISDEDQANDIFQPYRFLKHGELKAGRGTGLGLAICKEIVRMHSGQIWYTSKLDQGSSFHVSLPLEVSFDCSQRTSGSWQRQQRRYSRRRLSPKLLSHWNVMMPHLEMTRSISTPSTGLPSSSMISPDFRKASFSSNDDSIIIAPCLSDGDMCNVQLKSDKVKAEVSSDLLPLKITSSECDTAIVDNSSKCSTLSAISPSIFRRAKIKSIELTEADLANLTRIDGDENDNLFRDTVTNAVSNRADARIPSSSWAATPVNISTASPSFSGRRVVISTPSEEGDATAQSPGKGAGADYNTTDCVANLTNKKIPSIPSPISSSSKMTILENMNRQGVSSLNTPPSSPGNHCYSFYNVLIVDDVTSNRKLLALLLNKRGIHSITFAEDGNVGVDMVRDKGIDAFDLIFMDNTMPKMSGIDATQFIRKMGHDNLIIGVTGNSMEEELMDFLCAGADLVITKPLKPNVLDILLDFVSTFGCRSHPNQRLVIRNTMLEWVSTDASGHPVASHFSSVLACSKK